MPHNIKRCGEKSRTSVNISITFYQGEPSHEGKSENPVYPVNPV